MVAVPCNGCTLCCRNALVPVLPDYGDRVEDYRTRVMTGTPHGSVHVLEHKPNGDCIYLGEEGCTIHDRAPAVCRRFDCRAWFRRFSRNERRRISKLNPFDRALFAEGRKRLD